MSQPDSPSVYEDPDWDPIAELEADDRFDLFGEDGAFTRIALANTPPMSTPPNWMRAFYYIFLPETVEILPEGQTNRIPTANRDLQGNILTLTTSPGTLSITGARFEPVNNPTPDRNFWDVSLAVVADGEQVILFSQTNDEIDLGDAEAPDWAIALLGDACLAITEHRNQQPSI